MQAPSWVELYFDAGRYHETWGVAFTAIRRFDREDGEILVEQSARVTGSYAGPTPVEGIAAAHALRWARRQKFLDFETPAGGTIHEPILVIGDNQAVMGKLRNGNPFGRNRVIWEAMLGELKALKSRRTDVRIRWVGTWGNLAHHLVRPRTAKQVWGIPVRLELVRPG